MSYKYVPATMGNVLSPILYATEFVGRMAPHKYQEGKLWLSCADFGFAFCVADIDDSFGTIRHGDTVRIQASLSGDAVGWDTSPFVKYKVRDALGISTLAEKMLEKLFGHDIDTPEFDEAVVEHHMMSEHGVIDTDERDAFDADTARLPGEIFYRVVRVS